MIGQFSEVYTQALVVLSSNLPAATESGSASLRSEPSALGPQSLLLQTTFSSISAVWDYDLFYSYHELGEALSELKELGDGDEWTIKPGVYFSASYIASELATSGVPAPRIFSHGSESVVFNWSIDTYNVYLTISADRVSALISSPEKIQRRSEYSPKRADNPTAAFLAANFPVWSRPLARTSLFLPQVQRTARTDWQTIDAYSGL